MGLTSKLIYKNWDLSFSLRASLGNYNYNAVECSNSNLSSSSTYSGSTWHNVLDMTRPKNGNKCLLPMLCLTTLSKMHLT